MPPTLFSREKKVRSIRSGADGVVVQVQKHFRLILNHHPVRSIKGSFAIFFLMSRPPLLARRGDVAIRHLRHVACRCSIELLLVPCRSVISTGDLCLSCRKKAQGEIPHSVSFTHSHTFQMT